MVDLVYFGEFVNGERSEKHILSHDVVAEGGPTGLRGRTTTFS